MILFYLIVYRIQLEDNILGKLIVLGINYRTNILKMNK